jgi:hypothetical protein
MPSLFALPFAAAQQTVHNATGGSKKRKRHDEASTGKNAGVSFERYDLPDDEEYSAVVSPDERRQRRRAGYSLKASLPSEPFPHKDTTLPKRSREAEHSNKSSDNHSLRAQHIANVTAVLHKSMRKQDWGRARRALGLLMRTSIAGQPLDLRNSDYWGLGAEILFRQQPDPGSSWSTRGSDEAKEYYEKLIVRYPYHRASPNNVNAVDFYLALFSLWIYVAQAERDSGSLNGSNSSHDAVDRELEEAGAILARINKCMGTSPYAENEDFRQLRKHVMAWRKDLEREHHVDDLSPDSPLSTGHDLSFVTQRLSL